jgi:hypothetical protein
MKSRLYLGLILLGSSWTVTAQTTHSEPIFGSVLERKVQKDSTKKKFSFNPLKPAFLRIGLMGGGLIGFENNTNDNLGGSGGFRIEYGFSNRWSLVGEIQGNRFEGTTFSNRQSSLGFNWMPFKSRRLQPFFSLGGGVGGEGFRGGRFGKSDQDDDDNLFDNRRNHRDMQGFAFAKTGLNYVLFKRIIATAETGYQLPFNNSSSLGGLSLRAGAAYQFGKPKLK